MLGLDDVLAWLSSLKPSPRTVRNLKSEFRTSALAKVGVGLLVVVLLAATFAPLIVPHDPTNQNLEEGRLPPLGFSETKTVTESQMVNGSIQLENRTVYIEASPKYPLGTDNLGRDMLSRVVYGARTSLIVGILGTSLAALIGVTVGMIAGYYRGWVDDALMRGADVMLAFPSLVLAIALVGVWGTAETKIPDPLVATVPPEVSLPLVGTLQVPDVLVGLGGIAPWFRSQLGMTTGMPESISVPGTVIVVVALVIWVWFARVARGEALSVRQEEYVKAARSMGASDLFIIRKHVLPNSVTPILVLATIQIAAIILLESALSFLGFSGTSLSWGFDIAQGRNYLSSAWWIATMPGIAIVLTVIAINLIGDWLRDALDPGIQGEGNA